VPAPTWALIARAIRSAPSHAREQLTSDHRNAWSPAGDSPPVGSNDHTRPRRDRAGAVAVARSGLVEVHTAGPGCASTAGLITPLVFPDRGE
jgi:hypothetical protein